MNVQVVIPTAGVGKRFQSEIPKTLLLLKGRPIFVRALDVFEAMSEVKSVILVVNGEQRLQYEKAVKDFGLKKVKSVVIGGATRSESVRNGLKVLEADTEVVMIHDGARPLIEAKIVKRALELMKNCDAVVVAVPVKPTIKEVNLQTMQVEKTLDRLKLWDIQTPQIFKRQIIEQAYAQPGLEATDDSALVEQLGYAVRICEGNYRNLKITTPEDLILAEALLEK